MVINKKTTTVEEVTIKTDDRNFFVMFNKEIKTENIEELLKAVDNIISLNQKTD